MIRLLSVSRSQNGGLEYYVSDNVFMDCLMRHLFVHKFWRYIFLRHLISTLDPCLGFLPFG